MYERFFDKTTRQPKPLFWGVVGGLIMFIGLWTFMDNLSAWMSGRQYAFSNSRRGGSRMKSDIGTVVSLILAGGGAMTLWIAVTRMKPEFAQRDDIARLAAWIAFGLMTAIVGLGILVVISRIFR